MGGHALTPPTDRSLGRPLPCQLANQTHAHPQPPGDFGKAAMRQLNLIRNYSQFPVTMPRLGVGCVRVTHPCATRQHILLCLLPFDLHVLGLPLAFILSQDQTLRSKALRPPKGPCFYQQTILPYNSLSLTGPHLFFPPLFPCLCSFLHRCQ